MREDVIVLCHGGPIATPEDAEFVLGRTAICHGFYGASSMERLPTEIAIREQVSSHTPAGAIIITPLRQPMSQARGEQISPVFLHAKPR